MKNIGGIDYQIVRMFTLQQNFEKYFTNYIILYVAYEMRTFGNVFAS